MSIGRWEGVFDLPGLVEDLEGVITRARDALGLLRNVRVSDPCSTSGLSSQCLPFTGISLSLRFWQVTEAVELYQGVGRGRWDSFEERISMQLIDISSMCYPSGMGTTRPGSEDQITFGPRAMVDEVSQELDRWVWGRRGSPTATNVLGN